jgi:mono/diheme cytochrome c family protein
MSFKDVLFTKYLTIRNLFVAGNALLLVLFLAAVVKDNAREWKGIQKEYYKREIKRLHEEWEKAPEGPEKDKAAALLKNMKAQPVAIRQVIIEPMRRYDRCLTCHVAMDPGVNATQTSVYEDQPYVAKLNDIHKAHPVEKFGCTVCHGGQGLATTVAAAHGDVHHWEKPMMRGAYLQASCAKCHSNVWDAAAMPYAAAWRRGEELFKEKGCIGCHQVRGEGGPISVDLAEETADKPLTRIDFSHTGLSKEDRTLANWIRLHFVKPPSELVPGDPEAHFNDEPIAPSGMPFFDLSKEDADAVTTFVLSLSREPIPMDYHVPSAPRVPPAANTPAARGLLVYQKYGCAACHKADARGGTPNFNYENETEPNLRKSVGTYSRDELREKIQNGVPVIGKKDPKGATPPLYMPAWKDKIKGQELEDLLTYLFSIAEKQEEW